jgi:hypothetical protein
MGDGYDVDIEQLRTHAGNLEKLRDRFGAVKDASTHIAQDDQAYGVLCGWISGILEGRHQKQDDLVAYVEENLSLVAKSLRDAADVYEEMETNTAGTMNGISDNLGGLR